MTRLKAKENQCIYKQIMRFSPLSWLNANLWSVFQSVMTWMSDEIANTMRPAWHQGAPVEPWTPVIKARGPKSVWWARYYEQYMQMSDPIPVSTWETQPHGALRLLREVNTELQALHGLRLLSKTLEDKDRTKSF